MLVYICVILTLNINKCSSLREVPRYRPATTVMKSFTCKQTPAGVYHVLLVKSYRISLLVCKHELYSSAVYFIFTIHTHIQH